MGGSGGGRYDRPLSDTWAEKIQKIRQDEQKRVEQDVDEFLARVLAKFNDRDVESRRRRLDQLRRSVGDAFEVESILLGGSVAKHTDIDGLSDVDALLVLDATQYRNMDPGAVLDRLLKAIAVKLPRGDVKKIERGRLAVTVTYTDDLEIQLLPALRTEKAVAVPSSDGSRWISTRPKTFQRRLTRANRTLGGALVPAVKLLKSLVSDFPSQKRLSGYHLEAMAVEAARSCKGPLNPRAVLVHITAYAAARVLRPVSDPTGQTSQLDAELGPANGVNRRSVSQALSGLARRLGSATSVHQWRRLFED